MSQISRNPFKLQLQILFMLVQKLIAQKKALKKRKCIVDCVVPRHLYASLFSLTV